MGTWKTRGLRGSTLEDLINRTNDSYREKHLALIQKIAGIFFQESGLTGS